MQRPWELFENLNEMVYVSDMNTCEIEYMNKFALSTFGYKALKDVKGKKCYDVLQGLSSQCSKCTNSFLKENEFYEWEYYNAKLQKTYSLKDTMFEIDGKQYRMELAFDKNLQCEQKKGY